MTRLDPARAKSSAVAAPIPEEAPLMSAGVSECAALSSSSIVRGGQEEEEGALPRHSFNIVLDGTVLTSLADQALGRKYAHSLYTSICA